MNVNVQSGDTARQTASAPGNGREPTMADVAEHLGVSRQLVSMVLREQPGPSERSRARVKQAASDLGYKPHRGAQVLRRSRSTQIGVAFVPGYWVEGEIIEGMYAEAAKSGYGLMLSAQTMHHSTERALSELQGYRCAGLITIGSTMNPTELGDFARTSSVPVALVGHGTRNPAYDVIQSAGAAGIALCVDHLWELGHRDIAYIDITSLAPSGVRRRGYLNACRRLGLDPRIESSDHPYPEEGGAIAVRSLLERSRMATAVVAVNDQSCFGAAMELLRAGLSIPSDVSLTGYDDSRLASSSFFDLTTARQDATALGTRAVKTILRRVEDRSLVAQERIIRTKLIVRSSTAVPRRRSAPRSARRG